MRKNWRGIMKVLHIEHRNRKNELLWQARDLYNVLHLDGEEFLLRAAFTGGRVSNVIPEYYWLGMDTRYTPIITDTMDDILNEPSSDYGYNRQQISSAGDFTVGTDDSHWVASSPIVAFRAQNGSWGPVKNLFLTNLETDSGYLIATAPLSSDVTVADGDSITMRIAIMLRDCPT